MLLFVCSGDMYSSFSEVSVLQAHSGTVILRGCSPNDSLSYLQDFTPRLHPNSNHRPKPGFLLFKTKKNSPLCYASFSCTEVYRVKCCVEGATALCEGCICSVCLMCLDKASEWLPFQDVFLMFWAFSGMWHHTLWFLMFSRSLCDIRSRWTNTDTCGHTFYLCHWCGSILYLCILYIQSESPSPSFSARVVGSIREWGECVSIQNMVSFSSARCSNALLEVKAFGHFLGGMLSCVCKLQVLPFLRLTM